MKEDAFFLNLERAGSKTGVEMFYEQHVTAIACLVLLPDKHLAPFFPLPSVIAGWVCSSSFINQLSAVYQLYGGRTEVLQREFECQAAAWVK